MCLSLSFPDSSMIPFWQVSCGKTSSNGSTHPSQLKDVQVLWWLDMDIQLQLECEKGLHTSSSIVQVYFQHMDYVINLEHMTQLNMKTGALRRIRRRLLAELP